MKLDAMDHPKLHDLASRLGTSRPATIGHLELLWAFTSRYASEGDIGRHPVGAIARACDWMGEPSAFVEALVGAGWVDREGDTLTIHDWNDHRPRWVVSKVVRAARRTTVATTEPTVVATVVATTEVTPSLVKSSQAKPSQEREARSRAHALPDDFVMTPEREAYARDQGVANPRETFATFRDHFTANGKPLKDWDAAWRNWCRREKTFTRSTPTRDPKPHRSTPLSESDRARVLATQKAMDERAAALAAPVPDAEKAKAAAYIARLKVGS